METLPVEPWYPAWGPWVLWIVVLAIFTTLLAEWPKRLWFKPVPGEPPTTWLQKTWRGARDKKTKAGLLSPVLLAIGNLGGIPLFLAADLFSQPGRDGVTPDLASEVMLAGALASGVALFSSPIYYIAVDVIGTVPAIIKSRFGTVPPDDVGLNTTTTLPPVPSADEPYMDGPE